MKKKTIILIVIILAWIIISVVYLIPNFNSISKEQAIQYSRDKAKAKCIIILADRYNDYLESIRGLYIENDPKIEVINSKLLMSNDSIFYIQIDEDKFKFKYKTNFDSVNFNYELKLIEEDIQLENYKEYKY